jgi:two-component system chemotaxis response regulator CheB
VVVGASAGGVDALKRLVRDLPADLDAPVAVVLHVPPTVPSALPQILDRAGALPAGHAEDGDRLEPGRIYVAPPDYHLLVRDDGVRVVRGPRENGHRPAIDPLFRSAAEAYGPCVIAVVLSGALDDGAAGAVAVTRRGGTVVVQDPGDAAFGEMPRNAIADDSPAAVLPIARIGAHVAELVASAPPDGVDGPEDGDEELELAYGALEQEAIGRTKPAGDLAPFSCPACGGVLTEADDEKVIRFRCRVGHAYAAETLLGEQSETVEAALWTALRALEERADLSRRLARRFRRNDLHERAGRAEKEAHRDEQQAEVLRRVLETPVGGLAGERIAAQ